MNENKCTDEQNWETSCSKREDGQHCNCWYDGKACCACGDNPAPEPPIWCLGCGYHVEGGLCGYDVPCMRPT